MMVKESEGQGPVARRLFSGKSSAALTAREARGYALWELSRRAGITRDQFEAWRIERRLDRDVIWINGELPQRIEFPVAPAEFWDKLGAGQIEVARTSWMFRPSPTVEAAIPDFVVPFSSDARNGQPLFHVIDPTTVACTVDLLMSLLLTLSRYEEVVSKTCDVHGRFPASASLAVKHGFLERPIVDEIGRAHV